MITKLKQWLYISSDSTKHETIEGCIKHELKALLGLSEETLTDILKHREAVVDVLSTTHTSKPRARAINGGKKKRVHVIPKADKAQPELV